jgi:adenosylcobinamide kinase/adenosylcobinamide-phosphate guanylyltransferase
MGKIIFITGGARSGKSYFAEKLLKNKDKVLYIASAIAFDSEMKNRIEIHKKRRNENWETLEGYKNLKKLISEKISGKEYILFDCITVMLSNLMTVDNNFDWDSVNQKTVNEIESVMNKEVNELLEKANEFEGETIIVSNELGMGIVPNSPLGRYYRDIAGRVNQNIARMADEVYLLVSGIPLKIKGDKKYD